MEALQETKHCNHCDQDLPLSSFHKNAKSKDGLNNKCRTCNYAQSKQWKSANPERRRESYRRNRGKVYLRFIEKRYGVTSEQYQEMLRIADGKCTACGDKATKLVIDHDHSDGYVRGLVCSRCNLAIGHLNDDPERFLRVAVYVMQSNLKRGVRIIHDDELAS